jgi:hypothetical protein
MNRSVFKKTVLAVLLAAAAAGASAHRPWILPSASFVEGEDAWVTLDAAISEGMFYFDHLPLKLDGATVTDPDGAVTPLPAAAIGKLRTTVDLKMPKDGTYKVSLVNSSVMGSYKLGNEMKRFRSTEQAYAKEVPPDATDLRITRMHQRIETFVTANKQSSGALKPTGVGLELVPVTNPTDLRAGETARWRFQLDGKPLPNFPFSLVPGGVKYRGTLGEVRLATDAQGEASFKLPAANMYWVSASWPAVQAKGPGLDNGPADARRYGYIATVEVLPE